MCIIQTWIFTLIQTREHKNTHTHSYARHIITIIVKAITNIFLNLFSFSTHKVNIHKVKNVFILSIVLLFIPMH